MASSRSSYGGGSPSKIITPATCMCEAASSRWRNELSSPVRRSEDMAPKITSERQAELIVGHAIPRLLVEAGHAHAEKAHGTPRIETPEQLEGDRRDRAGVVHGGVDAARARHGAEVVEADLDADCAAAALLAGQRLAELAGEPLEHGLELRQAVQVVVEGGLARLRLGDPHRLDRALVLEAGERREVRTEPRAEPLGELLV